MELADLDSLDFSKAAGLLPAIVQHAGSGAVLMLGYMNRDALRASLTRRRVVFFSRSRQRLWEKGETSGHVLELAQIRADCDGDALLASAWPGGPRAAIPRAWSPRGRNVWRRKWARKGSRWRSPAPAAAMLKWWRKPPIFSTTCWCCCGFADCRSSG